MMGPPTQRLGFAESAGARSLSAGDNCNRQARTPSIWCVRRHCHPLADVGCEHGAELLVGLLYLSGRHIVPLESQADQDGVLFKVEDHRINRLRCELEERLVTDAGNQAVFSPLVGRFNVMNALGAAATALAAGIPLPAVATGLSAPIVIPGRMERVDAGQPFPVIVAYPMKQQAKSGTLCRTYGL